jgi:hypothetical protein
VWIALCRAAGIKARYKTFMMKLPDAMFTEGMTEQEAMTANFFNTGTPEGEGEVYIDGKWVVGHVAMRPELLARAGLPITKFGEDAIGMTFTLIPGTIKRFESIPLKLGIALKAGTWLAPAALERASVVIQSEARHGRKVFEEAGGREAYDQMARERLMLSPPTIEAKDDTALVFEA